MAQAKCTTLPIHTSFTYLLLTPGTKNLLQTLKYLNSPVPPVPGKEKPVVAMLYPAQASSANLCQACATCARYKKVVVRTPTPIELFEFLRFEREGGGAGVMFKPAFGWTSLLL